MLYPNPTDIRDAVASPRPRSGCPDLDHDGTVHSQPVPKTSRDSDDNKRVMIFY